PAPGGRQECVSVPQGLPWEALGQARRESHLLGGISLVRPAVYLPRRAVYPAGGVCPVLEDAWVIANYENPAPLYQAGWPAELPVPQTRLHLRGHVHVEETQAGVR